MLFPFEGKCVTFRDLFNDSNETTVESLLFKLGLLEFSIRQFQFPNQNLICIAFSTHVMTVGPIFTSPNHRSANYIRTTIDLSLLK